MLEDSGRRGQGWDATASACSGNDAAAARRLRRKQYADNIGNSRATLSHEPAHACCQVGRWYTAAQVVRHTDDINM